MKPGEGIEGACHVSAYLFFSFVLSKNTLILNPSYSFVLCIAPQVVDTVVGNLWSFPAWESMGAAPRPLCSTALSMLMEGAETLIPE
jgi:hypothetical protein